jgi:hypothetical protein
MDKQLRKAQGHERMNIMYAVSKVLRQGKKELKGRSKYGELGCVEGRRGWLGLFAACAQGAQAKLIAAVQRCSSRTNTLCLGLSHPTPCCMGMCVCR